MATDEHRCGLCDRPLKDRDSIERGFGPDCWSRLDATARTSVFTARSVDGEVLPGAAATTPSASERTEPAVVAPAQHHRRVGSPLAVAGAWAVVLGAVLVLLEYWRFVLVGVAIVGLLAVLGLLMERYRHRRPVGGGPPAR